MLVTPGLSVFQGDALTLSGQRELLLPSVARAWRSVLSERLIPDQGVKECLDGNAMALRDALELRTPLGTRAVEDRDLPLGRASFISSHMEMVTHSLGYIRYPDCIGVSQALPHLQDQLPRMPM